MTTIIEKGTTFGRLTILYETEPHLYPSGKPRRAFVCECICGRKKVVLINKLTSGHTQSCECLRRDMITERNSTPWMIAQHTTHGMSRSPFYLVYRNMLQRCYNKKHPQFKDWGGRGIVFDYDGWLGPTGYMNFLEWDSARAPEDRWKPGMTIERIDVNKGYHPDNCKWVPKKLQQRNKRWTIRRRFRGNVTALINIYDIGIEEGWILAEITYRCFSHRIHKLGWTIVKASQTPARKHKQYARKKDHDNGNDTYHPQAHSL